MSVFPTVLYRGGQGGSDDWVQDNEVYRATVRTQIREWLDSILAKHKQEWLIIQVSTGKGYEPKFYQRKGSVVDKIKADFNTGKRERSAVAPLSNGLQPIHETRVDVSTSLNSPHRTIRQLGLTSRTK